MIVLQLYALAEGSNVVAEMQLAGGAIAGQNGRVGIHQRLPYDAVKPKRRR